MFTGIVRAVALVSQLEKRDSLFRFSISLPDEILKGLEIGASVSIDGVCQTVVAIQKNEVWFEAIQETLNRTTLGSLKKGSKVNIERSVKMGDEIGGHLLSGHIYGTPTIQSIEENVYTLKCPQAWAKYLFSKGYVALDGVSLTLALVDKTGGLFSVHLIPETLKRTTLGTKKVGDLVNLELDAMTQAAVETIERIYTESIQQMEEKSERKNPECKDN